MPLLPDEFQLQRAFCFWYFGRKFPKGTERAGQWQIVPAKVPDVIAWHTPNGGSRHGSEAKNLKDMGVLPGVHDLLYFHRARLFGMEWKQPGGSLSPSQRDLHPKFAAQGLADQVTVYDLPTAKRWVFERGLALYC